MSNKYNKIAKEDFLKLNEDDVMFITNPGRMGDEDGSTFVIKNNNEYIIYRVDGWMYPTKGQEIISLDDTAKQFPKWYETWEHSSDENYQGKYKHLYMGFGNGLSIDKSIYKEYEPYLNKLVKEYLKDKKEEGLEYAAIFQLWEQALNDMTVSKNITLR